MADWGEFKVSGVTEKTPQNIMLGAGTLYRDLMFTGTGESGKWEGTIIGATSGGSKLSIVPELFDAEVDGVKVKAKGLTFKVGETASIETNMVEFTEEWVKSVVIGKSGTSDDPRFNLTESKPQITEGDYIKNFGFVGFLTTGDPIVIVFDNALCTSGLEAEGKNKENSVFPATFECYANLTDGATDTLPYHIYTVKPSA